MHVVNKILSHFGLQLSKNMRSSVPKEFIARHSQLLKELRDDNRGFDIFNELFYDVGVHPTNYIDYECGFTADNIKKLQPKKICDVGSYRHFILGMLSYYSVTTVDIRNRMPSPNNEFAVICDAKNLNLQDDEFDMVISLSALEHFGLGRYGDEFDLDADKKAFDEMIRVVKPNGHIIVTTTITNAQPSIVFNAHRIYDYEMIRAFCSKLICEEEKFYSHKIKDFCRLEEVTTQPGVWDVYLGCWKK